MWQIKEGKKGLGPKAVSFRWLKFHIRVKVNEEEDKVAKLGSDEEDPAFPVIAKDGLK